MQEKLEKDCIFVVHIGNSKKVDHRKNSFFREKNVENYFFFAKFASAHHMTIFQ